ncbi:MAG: FAD-binding oxidoreductase, partial [Burkholderiales bacterium]
SQNSVFYGSGQHGSAAESVLGLEVATAQGEILRTGFGTSGPGFSRWGGPDLAGLFLGDNGALGVKLAASLRLIEKPAATEYASFAFDTLATMVAAQITLARRGLGSEVFGIDAYKAKNSAQTGKKLAEAAQTALGVVKNSEGLLHGLRNVARMALSGTEALEAAAYSLHIALEDRDAARAGAALREVREVCLAAKGRELDALVPRAMHARPFPPLRSVLGGRGQRWVPVHGILSLADAPAAITAIEAHIRSRQEALLAAGIEYSPLLVNVSNGILFEPCFYWFDALTPLHLEAYGEGLDPSWRQRPDAPETRRVVAKLWEEVAALFTRFGATHFQLGRRYACRERLTPAAAALLAAVKRELDPQGLLNPGALGL